MKSGKHVILWISEEYVYILKWERTWWRTVRSCQACTYRIPEPLSVTAILDDVWLTYGLEGYTPSVVLSGPDLVWRKLAVTAPDVEQARQLAAWEEDVGGPDSTYTFTVVQAPGKAIDGAYEWFIAAYPKDEIQTIYDSLQRYSTAIGTIDVLPALWSRCAAVPNGSIYIPDGAGVHLLQVQDGAPLSYQYMTALSVDAKNWLTQKGQPTMLLETAGDGVEHWQECPVRPYIQKQQDRWQLCHPFSLLAAF